MNEVTLFSIAIPLFIVTMIGEYGWIHLRKKTNSEKMLGYEPKDTAASLIMGLGFLALGAAWKVVQLSLYYQAYQLRFFEVEATASSWVLLFLLQDFFFYWRHRASHRHRILWAGHVNHHSSERYNLSTALRQSWSAHLTAFVFYLPILVLGFPPQMLLTAGLLHLFYQYWIHTEAIGTLGPLEHVLMTPSHHRVHHAVNGPYLDRNHGGMLILWDKLFGTFEPEGEPPIYGITTNLKTFNPLKIAFHEYGSIWRDVRKATSPKTALGHVFLSPGWVPARKKTPRPLAPPSPSENPRVPPGGRREDHTLAPGPRG